MGAFDSFTSLPMGNFGREPDLSAWEGRMSARAQEHLRAQAEVERIREQAARLAEDIVAAAEEAAEYSEGPPDGCATCYEWSPNVFAPGHSWAHLSMCACPVCPGPQPMSIEWPDGPAYSCSTCGAPVLPECRHACHGGEPYPCTPVAIG